ncbi:p47 [Fopius arisanus]|nr:p47 [Fopius arisanus]
MNPSLQSTVERKKFKDVISLASKITHLMCDETIHPQALAIAQFILFCRGISLERASEQLEKPGARDLINKLLDSESDFMSPTPRSLGTDIVAYISAAKIQKSLDVKQIQMIDVSKTMDRIIPNIKTVILYNHPTLVWIRFHCENIINITIPQLTIVPVNDSVYEAYMNKTRNAVRSISDIIQRLENEYAADIIFCSELSYFMENKLLFVSNYVKFTWCYAMSRDIFDPQNFEDLRVMSIYMTYSLMFLNTTNLTNMSDVTHNPLIAYTGERPRTAIARFNPLKTYTVEGNRAMQTVDKGSDFGTKSNFIEIISHVIISDGCLDKIL